MIRQYIRDKKPKSVTVTKDLNECRPDEFLIFLARGNFKYNESGDIDADIYLADKNEGEYICTNNMEGREIFRGTILDRDFFSLNVPGEREIKKFLSYEINQMYTDAVRWTAGGALPVIKLNGKHYFVMEKRSRTAPVYPNHLNNFAGLSETIEEVINPRLIIMREFYEELLIFDSNFDHRFYAKPSKNQYSERDIKYLDKFGNPEKIEGKSKYKIAYAALKKKMGKEPETKEISSEIKFLGRDSFTLHFENGREHREEDTFLVIDPVNGAIDEIAAVLIDFDSESPGDAVESLEDLRFVFFDHQKTNEKDYDFRFNGSNHAFLLNEIYLVDLDNLRELIKGNRFRATLYHTIKDGDRIESLHPNPVALKKPALSTQLRQALIRAYNAFSGEEIPEYGYKMYESNPVEDAYIFNNYPGE